MQYSILLDTSANSKIVETQEQARFVKTIIDCLEVPIEFDPDKYNIIDEQIKLRAVLQKYKISIINDMNGGMKIFFEQGLIAEWKKCKFKLREDVIERDPKRKLFTEMMIEFWSIFEEEHGEQKNKK